MKKILLPIDGLIRRKGLVILPADVRQSDPRPFVGDVARQAAQLALYHMFSSKSQRVDGPRSKFNPRNELISPDCDGQFSYKIDSVTVNVSRVLLLGSNWPMWVSPKPKMFTSQGPDNILEARVIQSNVFEFHMDPENSELMAFCSILAAKGIFDRHEIPATILYMPSDLPPGKVENIEEIRRKMKSEKEIHPHMKWVLDSYGYSGLPVISRGEIREDPRLALEIAGANAIWYTLESEFRNQARQLVEDLVALNIEGTVEKYFMGGKPGNLEQWRKINLEKRDTWQLVLRDGTYHVLATRHEKQALPIPIGRQVARKDKSLTAGAPMCALITTALLRESEQYGFDHLVAAFHNGEAPIASAGIFLARRLFGVDMHAYVLQVNRTTCTAKSTGLDGKHAFLDRLTELEVWEEPNGS